MSGTLYVVATPIGNLADITLRALSTLREVDLIAAEDTRVTRNLLNHYGIETPMTPYHQHSRGRKAERLLDELQAGKNIALVSDAGMPGVSDPGHELITLAIEHELSVAPIPGANAAITALVVSGLPTQRFSFDGFPPRSKSDRRAFLESLRAEKRTVVLYESPHRLLGLLKDMLAVLGDRRVAVARELTKLFEELHRGTISSAIERFNAVSPRGEITIVMAGMEEAEAAEEVDEKDLDEALQELIREGISTKDAVERAVKVFPLPRREIYQRLLTLKERT